MGYSMIRIILNGKKVADEDVRYAVSVLREEGIDIEVRVTWEHGDAQRMVAEASDEGITRIIAAGGDGTLNEVVNGLALLPKEKRPQLAILPLGTANDFATACRIPFSPLEALRLAVEGEAYPVDIVKANDRYFINVASSGFGAQIVADTPASLKNFLGGGAYTLSAVIMTLNYSSHEGRLIADDIDIEGKSIAGVICNGRQAGGGQMLAPFAYIDDGMLDIVVFMEFPITDLGQVIAEMFDYEHSGTYIKRFQKRWVESIPQQKRSVNLDGEPYEADRIRFEVLHKEIDLILPKGCPVLKNSGSGS
ncbi:lipid kinase YegS [Sulfurovum indicum]|nr:lipid kinase YegS [Sulfurovum indicum]